MTPEMIFDFGRDGVMTLLIISAPIMIVALTVGLLIALFQALTSIQEITLTFVPKILLVFLAMLFLMPFMANRLFAFGQEIFVAIATG